nr:hypothetical protein [Methylobacterium sp. ZNC0032]
MGRNVQATDYLFALLAGMIAALLTDASTMQENSYFPFGFVAIVAFTVVFTPNFISLPVIGSMRIVRRRRFYIGVLIINSMISATFAYALARALLPNLSAALKIAITMGTASLLASAIYAALCRWR